MAIVPREIRSQNANKSKSTLRKSTVKNQLFKKSTLRKNQYLEKINTLKKQHSEKSTL